MTAPPGNYHPSDRLQLDGRTWLVASVAHTGKEITIITDNSAGRFRRERIAVQPTPQPKE